MTLRRKSREFALQMLFEWDMGHQEPTHIEKLFWKSAPRRIKLVSSPTSYSKALSPRRIQTISLSESFRKTGDSNAWRPWTAIFYVSPFTTSLRHRASEGRDRRSSRAGEKVFVGGSSRISEWRARRRSQKTRRLRSCRVRGWTRPSARPSPHFGRRLGPNRARN